MQEAKKTDVSNLPHPTDISPCIVLFFSTSSAIKNLGPQFLGKSFVSGMKVEPLANLLLLVNWLIICHSSN